MEHIRIESDERGTRVEINGATKRLTEMIANAIINDPHFGILVMTAIAAIAAKESNPLNDINLN